MAKKIGQHAIILLCLVAVGAQAANNKLSDDNNFCQGCKSIVSFTQTLNASNERDGFRDLLAGYCNQYYPPSTDFQGPCPIFVDAFFTMMDRIDPVHHCDEIGACGSSTPDVAVDSSKSVVKTSNFIQPSRSDNMICEICEQMIQQAQTILTDPKCIDLIEHQMDAFCDYLVVIEQDKECRQLERKYLKQAIEFIKSIDPKQYCKSVQLCEATQSRPKYQVGQVTKHLPSLIDFTNFGIETSVVIGNKMITNSKIENEVANSNTHYKHGPNCLICKAVIKEMFHFLRENKTEENIMIGLDRVCKVLYRHDPSLGQCYSMVKAYTKEIIQLLIDETNPEMICMMLSQCTFESRPPTVQDTRLMIENQNQMNNNRQQKFGLSELITALDSSVELKSTRSCVECKIFIKYLKGTLVNPTSQEYLKDWLLNHLCADLPNNLSGSCTEMVKNYSDILFRAVAGSLNPNSACIELDVCPKQQFHEVLVIDNDPTSLPLPPPYRRRLLKDNSVRSGVKMSNSLHQIGGQICDQCVNIITQIDSYLSTHSIDGDVSVLVDKVCNNMPEGVMRSECTLVIEAFGSSLVRMIADMKNPREVCAKINLC